MDWDGVSQEDGFPSQPVPCYTPSPRFVISQVTDSLLLSKLPSLPRLFPLVPLPLCLSYLSIPQFPTESRPQVFAALIQVPMILEWVLSGDRRAPSADPPEEGWEGFLGDLPVLLSLEGRGLAS